ncbi:cytochrome c [Sulfurimonas sp. HSL3-2]|uniref:c-type cytochrome n=1 Tax=Hydrocurvibacter mobilis TaxID=3131936 RepID=UPI0031F91537
MKLLLLLITPIYIFAAASFITEDEYASSLYKNPRGIGCDKCHGADGKGLLVAKYVSNGVTKEFKGPDITELGFKVFYEALDTRKSGMPRYFLTKDEIETLYKYLHKEKK